MDERGKMSVESLIKELNRATKDYIKNEDIEIYESKLKIIKEKYQIGEPIICFKNSESQTNLINNKE